MDEFDDLVRRLRVRMDRSANRERSLDWKAADAIDQLQDRAAALEAENKRLGAENQALREGIRISEPQVQQQVVPQGTPPALGRALDLREAAALLGVSYGTVYAHKLEMGFFQIGNQWRVWPDKLKEMTSGSTAGPPVSTESPSRQQDEAARTPAPQLPMSARKAAAEFEKLLAEHRRGRPKRGASK
ncbi:hypothetical protein G3N58_25445 [Paraburkholderia sp. Ac-20342]|uniref:hypothetical protein n=1 Tax=unclassified Paraburkholderia TaxID=2615204 RepID=UPI0014215EE1|nr:MULTISPECIES: hypothetical protein [unclassified Paraburkholderia]MBN3850139.1 hypothetical protein [Paraburkholderia sp. Ac-20342]NIF78899.1 hypothetical protein [Paraburkholderia sp. Cy-641]